ncbi:MAG: TerB family tellurite resistance protein [Rhodobacteraceae bacterium]|nr:TerB family tellurite resistance protein [Paracoccaceae bacterium]
MFDALLKRLTGPAPTPLPPADARLALTALLVRIARSDGDYADVEIAQITRIVSKRYDLDADTTTSLLWEAEALEEQAPDTVRFTRAIKDAVPYEDRVSVVSAAWAVVLADGERADEENALMRLIANLLGVNDRDSHISRLKREREAE